MALLKATLAAVAIFYMTGAFAVDAAPPGTSTSVGARFRDCPECPQMIVIPSGKFTMTRKSASDGRRDDDPEGIPKSVPAKEVTIDAPLAVGIYDVTRDEYGAFVRETHHSTEGGCYIWNSGVWIDDPTKSWRNPGFRQGAREPVVCVNWEDAEAYVHWLNSKVSNSSPGTGSPEADLYRLPSWEEVEYAARGGAVTPYYWGPEARRDRANYGAERCFPCRPEEHGADRWLYTSAVGSFPPNAFGLYDMAGNVWQWTENCVRGSPSGLRMDSPGPNERCGSSALHGGSWLENPEYLRVGAYALSARINRRQTAGFRVARTLVSDADPKKAGGEQSIAASESAADADITPTQPRVLGKKFQDCTDCPEMIVIPAGSFMMGSSLAGHTWDTRDVPEHRVTLDRDFAVGIYDVTRAQYGVFVRQTHRPDGHGCDVLDPVGHWITDPAASWHDPSFQQTDRDPVVCVSWNDAQEYVRWLNRRVGNGQQSADSASTGLYRLLSEAEWEYAARAGTSTPFYWGSVASHDEANYGSEQCFPCGAAKAGKDRWYYTSPVGSFAPNSFGLYDMLGNVWQWTQDCMHYGYGGAPQDGSVWPGGECKLRVIRGGSWLDPGRYVAVTTRNPWGPGSRNRANGFRVARSLN